MDVAKNNKIGISGGGDCEEITVKILLLTAKNLNKAGYLTPRARLTFIQLRQAFSKAPVF